MSMTKKPSIIIFGATGSIGTALSCWFGENGWQVTAVSRSANRGVTQKYGELVAWEPFETPIAEALLGGCLFDAAVWAQGSNCNDNIFSFERKTHEDMYRANVTYVMATLHELLVHKLLTSPSRLCVVSSIWQNIARQNKLSYCVTKAALQGLIQSLMIDLGPEGYLVNAVLPGVLDTPMTRNNLSPAQLQKVELMTPLGTLPSLDDVCNLVGFLCSKENTGITGQFITADRGFSYARTL